MGRSPNRIWDAEHIMQSMGGYDLSPAFQTALLCLPGNPREFIRTIAGILESICAGNLLSMYRGKTDGEILAGIEDAIDRGARDEYQFYAAVRSPDITFIKDASSSEEDQRPGGYSDRGDVSLSAQAKDNGSFELLPVGDDFGKKVKEVADSLVSRQIDRRFTVDIVTGPIRSGKSTMMAGIEKELTGYGYTVVHVTNPVEFNSGLQKLVGHTSLDILRKKTDNRDYVLMVDDFDVLASVRSNTELASLITTWTAYAKKIVIEVNSHNYDSVYDVVKSITSVVLRWNVPEYSHDEVLAILLQRHLGSGSALSPDSYRRIIDSTCSKKGNSGLAKALLESDMVSLFMERDHLGEDEAVARSISHCSRPSSAKDIERKLSDVIIGQTEVIRHISPFLWISTMAGKTADRPGVFLFYGPSGVGKTELARTISDLCFDGNLHVEDMSQYFGEHYASRFIGAPPGYVGYDKTPEMLSFIRNHRRGVIILDEIEKANRQVKLPLMQIFDTGECRDSSGNSYDARSFLFIMTSNITFDKLSSVSKNIGFKDQTSPGISTVDGDCDDSLYRKEIDLTGLFRKEELNRISCCIRFAELNPESVDRIIDRTISTMLSDAGLDGTDIPVGWKERARKQYSGTGTRGMRSFVNVVLRTEILSGRNACQNTESTSEILNQLP